jgi:hAT family C-terminal dimerisation region
MDILPIQASSVPCERVFSSSKETITARRNKLSPQLVEALQLLKFSSKQGRGISFTQGLDKKEELAELVREEERCSVEDLHSYLHSLQDC